MGGSSFITQPPSVNRIEEIEGDYFLISDSTRVCGNDSTVYFSLKTLSKNDTLGRFSRCIHCGRIYKLHNRWLNEEERRLKQIKDENS